MLEGPIRDNRQHNPALNYVLVFIKALHWLQGLNVELILHYLADTGRSLELTSYSKMVDDLLEQESSQVWMEG